MSLYLTQLELHRQTLQFNLDEINDQIEYTERNLQRMRDQKENTLKGLQLADQMIENEKHGE